MKGITEKGKDILRELNIESLNEEYYISLYATYKDFFFDNPKSSPLPTVKSILIGGEVIKYIKEMKKFENLSSKNYTESISERANDMAICQAVFVYVGYKLIDCGKIKSN